MARNFIENDCLNYLYESNCCGCCRDLLEKIITLGFYYREIDRFASKSRNLSWIRSANASPLERAAELSKSKTERPSVYRRAIANGIVEILSVYRSAVLLIEQKLLSETMPILATVTQGLNKVGGSMHYAICLLTNFTEKLVVLIQTLTFFFFFFLIFCKTLLFYLLLISGWYFQFFVLFPPLYELVLEIERDDIRGGQLLNLLHKRCHCGMPELQACIQRYTIF